MKNQSIKKTSQELKNPVISELIKKLKKHGVKNPIKSKELVAYMNDLVNKSNNNHYSDVELRKQCNYIRINSLLPVIAGENGYFVTTNKSIILSQISSLKSRASSINSAAKGLQKFLI